MPQAIRVSSRAIHALGFVAALGVAAAVSASGIAACITAPPPDLPALPLRGPRIIEDSVRPPTDQYLTMLPADSEFVVPVEVNDPTEQIVGRVFVDFYPGSDNMGSATSFTAVPPALDGGVTTISFSVSSIDLGDPTACHIIQLFVADQSTGFSEISVHTAGNSLGVDSVSWFYTPNGPSGCFAYDAGDGAPADAAPDGTLVIPQGTGSH
jgi:hypothetical protein